jgi:hypothetical protein
MSPAKIKHIYVKCHIFFQILTNFGVPRQLSKKFLISKETKIRAVGAALIQTDGLTA